MSTQYNAIGKRYGSMKELPAAEPERPSVVAALGDVKGLIVLDLACGLGTFSRLLIELGAVSVVGVDISEAMVEGAQQASSSMNEQDRNRLHYIVGDCSKPTTFEGGPFDLVFAGWFLNYAPDYETMLAMWQNIHSNLKPGGRFVGLTPNVELDVSEPLDPRYGTTVEGIERVENGWKCRLTAFVKPTNFSFEMYHLHRDVYERAAAKAGMKDLRWHKHILPDDDRKAAGYWDVFDQRPHLMLFTALK